MKIGVLSDSHVNQLSDLPKDAIDYLREVDLIVHAGDYIGEILMEELMDLGDFRGVYGNIDPLAIRTKLPTKLVLEIKNFKIGITHPSQGGPPYGIEARIKKKFPIVDAIIFGHTHTTKNEIIDETLFFNPGSITGKSTQHKTIGILEVDKEIKGKIIKI